MLTNGDRVRVGPHLELEFAIGAHDETAEHVTSTAITDLRQTATLLETLRSLGTSRVLDHVLETVVDSAIALTGAERAFIMLVAPSGELEFKLARNQDKQTMPGTQFQTSRKISEQVFQTGETRLVEDLLDGDLGARHEGTIALGIRNVLCASLHVV